MPLSEFPKYPTLKAVELLTALHRETVCYKEEVYFPHPYALKHPCRTTLLYCFSWHCRNRQDYNRIRMNRKNYRVRKDNWWISFSGNGWGQGEEARFKIHSANSLYIYITFINPLTEPEIIDAHLHLTQIITHLQKAINSTPSKFKYENN